VSDDTASDAPGCETFTFPLNGTTVAIGRDPSCAVAVVGVGISRIHARIVLDSPAPRVVDGGSAVGTLVNDQSVPTAFLTTGDTLSLGVAEFTVAVAGGTLRLARTRRSRTPDQLDAVVPERARSLVGRDPSCDIRVEHPLVSRFHAELLRGDDGAYRIADAGSTNGVFVNGRAVRVATIGADDIVQIGPYRFYLVNGRLHQADDANRVLLEATGLGVRARGAHLLRNMSLRVNPGEFVALMGPSGSGKTTLASALAGRISPSAGTVLYNGLPLRTFMSAFSSRIGFVSQDNVLHRDLTVGETFREQSTLRLARDSTPQERSERVRVTLELLGLTPLVSRRIGRLSGGEAKRVHFGIELLSSPSFVFLDEPLAGLDAGLTERFMELFRSISRKGHTVLVTTHTLEQLDLCDRVLFLHEGAMLYDGVPAQMAQSFGVRTVAEVYARVREHGAAGRPSLTDLRREEASAQVAGVPSAHARVIRSRSVSGMRQVALLVARYLKLWVRDGRNALLSTLQIPLIALLLVAVFGGDRQFLPPSFYFCVVISAIWCGGIGAIREIAGEWGCFDRDYRAGMSPIAYVLSKTGVFSLVSALQGVLFVGCLGLFFEKFPTNADVGAPIVAATVSGALLGLCLSAVCGTVARAVTALPLALIPQILFSGVLLPFDQMPAWGRVLSHLTISRPAFSILKRVAVMDQALWQPSEWYALLALAVGAFILVVAAVGARRAFQRW